VVGRNRKVVVFQDNNSGADNGFFFPSSYLNVKVKKEKKKKKEKKERSG
jgi:hypothetical protein